MLRRYGQTQVCEFRLTQAEVDRLVIQNASHRLDPSYDFDKRNPVLLKDGGDYIVRFVQQKINQDGCDRDDHFEPFEKVSI